MTKKHIQWILVVFVVLIVGIFFLQLVGRLFIQEVVQEVAIPAPTESIGVAIDEKAPHFELSDVAGQKAALSDFLGTPLVLTFWTTWNTTAADQINIFDVFLSSYEPLFKIITINNQEERGVVSQFLKRGAYQVPTFLDESGAVGELYRAHNLPTTYFIDRDGVVRDIFVGPLNEEVLLEKTEILIR